MTDFKPLPLLDIGGIWHIAYFVGIAVILLITSRKLVEPFLPFSARLLWCYTLLRALFIVEYPQIHFGQYTHDFQATAGQVFIEALFIPFAVISFPNLIKALIPYVAVFASLCVWFGWPGLLHAPSFNMALAMMCLPVIRWRELEFFIVFTALTHHGFTALLIYTVQIMAGIHRRKMKLRYYIAELAVIIASGFFFYHRMQFNSGTERLTKWAEYFLFWIGDWKRIIFGVGPGSFVWYSTMAHPYQTGLYLQMHCDYFEIAWGLGLIGVVMAGFVLRDAIKRAWNLPIEVLQGILGCLAFMLTYQPLEYFPTALLTAWFFAQALVIENVDVKFASFVWPVKCDNG